MKRGAILFFVCMMIGCSQKTEEATQKVIDAGTGKSQIGTYQQLQKQIKTINKERSKQFDEMNP